jgi:hypothetical protein
VLEESLPDMREPLRELRESVGKRTPQKNLELALRGVFSFHQRVTPMLAGLFSEPELLAEYRARLSRADKGPHLATRNLAEYIRSEQQQQRIHASVDADLAAGILMSSSFFRAFNQAFFGHAVESPWDKFAAALVASVTAAEVL